MGKDSTNKKILYAGLVILFIIFVVGIVIANNKKVEEYNFPEPDLVVEQYFNSWSNKDYANMYATFSDGFKKIEPTAKTFQDFKNYVENQDIESINIINIKIISNDELTSKVDYNVEFISSEWQNTPYQGTFTLKYRKGDVIQGWKLIHPYGENIDNS